ncbi:MAG: sigma 54-interacting transcriptional regulator, partial [Candidatus Eisenbacteria bacterium]|nr:sigma 54-interacting transcriptional regulator [Candidatus Eisenbacteria bacterium]
SLLAITQWKRGKLAEALEEATACVEQGESSGHLINLQYAHLLRTVIQTHAGAFDGSLADLRSVRSELEPGDSSRPALLAIEYMGDVFLEQGRGDQALEQYEAVWPRALALVPRGDIVAELRHRMAECHFLAGKHAKAVEWCEGSLEHARELGDRYEEAATYRVLAMAQAALGQHELARKAFDQGFTLYDEIETPYEWGKLWLAYGDWLVAESSGAYRNLSAAHEAYRVAIDHFEGMGAEYRLSQARARLEALDALVKNDGEELASPRAKVRPVRRPRHSAETLRKAQWVLETYGIVTRNRSMLDMLTELEAVAKSDLPVMVLGESGTGKELIAQGVHKLSGRVGRMVALNCSAIPASMLESEIFGHVKGAFTNAIVDKPGLFEVADGGTIFLDEIGEMAPDLQAKLLRVLELGVVRRIGGTDDIRVRSRVVAATNRDRSAMQNGQGFRSDLYYRLAHAVYELPGLRTRGDDIELLVEHFLAVFNREHGKTATLTPSARERLCDYPWPGNIRQLRAVVEKMVVAAPSDGKLTPRDVPLEDAGKVPTGMMAELDAEEARRIRKALSDANGIKTAAAEILGISRTTLLGKMKRLGIE